MNFFDLFFVITLAASISAIGNLILRGATSAAVAEQEIQSAIRFVRSAPLRARCWVGASDISLANLTGRTPFAPQNRHHWKIQPVNVTGRIALRYTGSNEQIIAALERTTTNKLLYVTTRQTPSQNRARFLAIKAGRPC